MNLGVLILAAGRSGRMGRPKLMLPWGDGTVLSHLLKVWTQLGAAQAGVVWSEAAPEVRREVERFGHASCHAIQNPSSTSDMWSSVQSAVNWQGWDKTLTHFGIVLGDQPHVRLPTLREFLSRIEGPGAWVPQVGEQRCHPVVIERSCWDKLKGHRGPTLREFLHSAACELRTIELADPALTRDIDTPADWRELGPA